ncbi:MAG: M18 family aminopeptidase, partial [Planctomycetota bacterium]|nr:M18 family aminopeptidase [Planctomycetota bacterium]
MPEPRAVALGLADFSAASPSPYHACATAAARLEASGFCRLDERAAWDAIPERAYLQRGGSLMAWALPAAADPAEGFRLVGAHTDSPNLRVKPRPDTGGAGFRQVGVEVYGGVLLNSWLDRDLGLSGRAWIDEGGGLEERLFLVQRPVMRVPQLAIHLDRAISQDGLKLDRQQHMAPITAVGERHEGAFRELLAAELGCEPAAIKSWDAMLHDLTPSRLIGVHEDMLAAPRLDNLCSAYLGLEAVIAAADAGAPRGVAVTLFDHEEVGSGSRGGADGPIL